MPKHLHHHSLFAGLGAGAAAVLVGGLVILASWHAIAGPIALAASIIIWCAVAAVVTAVVLAAVHIMLRVRHDYLSRAATLPPRPPRTVVPDSIMYLAARGMEQELSGDAPRAIESGQHVHVHVHPDISPEAASALFHGWEKQ